MRPLLTVFFALVAGALPAAASTTGEIAGTWHAVPAAPAAVLPGTSVWTGTQLLVFGNSPFARRRGQFSVLRRGQAYLEPRPL